MISARPIKTDNQYEQSQQNDGNSNNGLRRALLRILLLDLPLVMIFAAYVSALALEKIHADYLEPLKSLMEWTDDRRDLEVTYMDYFCTADDITAGVADELVIEDGTSTREALDHMQVHGASLYKNILTNATADAVRDFIVEENLRQEGWFVINNKNRYSWGIEVDQHPSIAVALKEISNHSVLRPVLEKLLGRNPAVIEFTAITSTYGAETQTYHQDVVAEGSAAKYARSFLPSYSLFIPLQDTTQAMGATDLCPGTQLCANDPQDLCQEYGFPVSGSNNKWPKGWGALLNQQLTHRGTAHTDRYGPERVVFILTFAPRPQYSLPGVVESRLIGQSGSYSLHWKQWGHTLDDFGAAPQNMAQPFRMLRSLGLYKPASADWGWDIVTVALMRMANGDNGYVRDSLEEFVEKGGFALLPQWLQAPINENFDYDQGPLDGGWHEFLLGTFQLVKEALSVLNQTVSIVFVAGLCLVSIWTTIVHKSPRKGFSLLARNTCRVLLTHGVVLGVAWHLYDNLSTSHWARHIQNGKLFRPYRDAVVTEFFDMDHISELGFTLPFRRDVMLASHYKSKHLASYADILDFNHRGNQVWTDLVATHSQGFDGLTPALKNQLCQFLVEDEMLRTHQGRVLYQPEAGRWAVMPEEDAQAFCKTELLMGQNPLLGALLKEIEYLETETEFGTWRAMAIYKTSTPAYLKHWWDQLIGLQSTPTLPTTTSAASMVSLVASRKALSIENTFLPTRSKKKSQVPSSPPAPRPPFRSAWFAIGDTVEGQYRGEFDEWYRGTVVEVSLDQDVFDVVYDDGEEDFGLCRLCVRPFTPFHVGEVVEARVDEDTFERVKIVAAHRDGTFSIRFLDDYSKRVHRHFPMSNLRRFK